jgi:hypothetical protein
MDERYWFRGITAGEPVELPVNRRRLAGRAQGSGQPGKISRRYRIPPATSGLILKADGRQWHVQQPVQQPQRLHAPIGAARRPMTCTSDR